MHGTPSCCATYLILISGCVWVRVQHDLDPVVMILFISEQGMQSTHAFVLWYGYLLANTVQTIIIVTKQSYQAASGTLTSASGVELQSLDQKQTLTCMEPVKTRTKVSSFSSGLYLGMRCLKWPIRSEWGLWVMYLRMFHLRSYRVFVACSRCKHPLVEAQFGLFGTNWSMFKVALNACLDH